MPPDLKIAALAVGAVLLLAALLGGRILGHALRTTAGTWVRAAIGVAGVALIGWGLASYLGSSAPPKPQPAVATTPPPATVDLVQAATTAVQDCPLATAPAVPDGATASRKQMAAARSAFQAYDGATNAYVHCVDAAVDRIAARFANQASESDLQSLRAFGARAHDTAIDQEQAVADQFNSQIRTYKARHPKS